MINRVVCLEIRLSVRDKNIFYVSSSSICFLGYILKNGMNSDQRDGNLMMKI